MDEPMEIIDRLKKSLTELLPMKAEYQQRLDKKIRLEFNYNSNHIEGNTLTYGETELLLVFGKTTGNHELREYEEMKAHDVAYEMIKEWATDNVRPLTETAIKNLHALLLVQPFWKEAVTPDGQATRRLIKTGQYKEYPNSVRLEHGEMFHYSSPEETPIQMGELIEWYRKEEEKKELNPAGLAALLHYKFVRIHPFDDGNGRLSRLLMNYVLLKHGYPPVVIRSSDKRNYLFALNQADTGNFEAFSNYIAEQLIWILQLTIKAAKGESVEDPNDWQKNLQILKQKMAGGVELIEVTRSVETIKNFVTNSIIPLMGAWDEKLKLFDPLFLNRNHRLTWGVIGNASSIGMLQLFKRDEQRFYEDLNKTKELIKFTVSFTGLRNKNNTVNMNGGEITLQLFRNAYEISYTGSQEKINKLYSQNLSSAEIENIINSIGTWFMKNVEEYLEKG